MPSPRGADKSPRGETREPFEKYVSIWETDPYKYRFIRFSAGKMGYSGSESAAIRSITRSLNFW